MLPGVLHGINPSALSIQPPSPPSLPPDPAGRRGVQGGLVDFLQCSQLSGQIPRPPKRGMAAEAGEENFYSIMIDKRKVRRHRRAPQQHPPPPPL